MTLFRAGFSLLLRSLPWLLFDVALFTSSRGTAKLATAQLEKEIGENEMRKVVMLNRVTIDGFFAGPNGEIDWFVPDPEVDKAVHAPQPDRAESEQAQPGTVLFGRVTYQLFERNWPSIARDPNAPKEARAVADALNKMTKIVFSRTLQEVTWENSKLVKGNIAEEVRKLKEGDGPDMLIFGSGTIIQQLTDERLIDDYILIVTPVVLGTGKPLFSGVSKLKLGLVEARGFKSGNVLLHYNHR